ncbi:MAG: hypothetical protein WBK19_14755 [Azonexus sp.]
MALNRFILALLPVWSAEFLLFAMVHGYSITNDHILSASWLASSLLLPIVAGNRIARQGGNRMVGCAGGASVSVVTLVCLVVIEVFSTSDWLAVSGFAFATIIFTMPIQSLSGLVGHWIHQRPRSRQQAL